MPATAMGGEDGERRQLPRSVSPTSFAVDGVSGFGKASGPFTPHNTQHSFANSHAASGSTVSPPLPHQSRTLFPSKTKPVFGLSHPSSSPAETVPQRQPHPSFPSKINNVSGPSFPNSTPTPRAQTFRQPFPPTTTSHQGTQIARGPSPPSSFPTYRAQTIPSSYLPPSTQAANVHPTPRSYSPNNQAMNGASSPHSPFFPDSQPHLASSSPLIPRSRSPKNQMVNGPSPPRPPFPRNQSQLTRSPPPQEFPQWQSSSGPNPQSKLHKLPPEGRQRSDNPPGLANCGIPLASKSPGLPNPTIPLADHANALDQTPSKSAAAPGYSNERTSMFPPNPVGVHAPKRNRSPPPIHFSESSEDATENERELHAKAKRLARFGAELNYPVANVKDSKWNKSSEQKQNHSLSDKRNLPGSESGKTPEESFGNIPDVEGQEESSTVVTGLCQDMCPASEREERERKADLDQYERLDGDRNRTNRFLAVKKYNRMAEREALLIRPIPVLQKTVDYLLQLLEQPYTDKFLGIYNFLWDRMRAIRMDLRMQHIFNQEAITMLEQMIRLHIIAMHELCEYKRGEGFSEGFDAHLNIEQMNKTSVELFQMYDDHRKKGIDVPTEKEFRGYYALLKLDKHPGYKVEPAELSLDLAKMTPQIRGTPEILFARAVARACRTSNFIAFFRLARKASYLQACLMHAHFSKLRTSALASLHNSLQNNQGIPVEEVVKWLALEGEDVEALLEYHGFAIKEYQEAYMVKEGPFLNMDVDYPTKCSELVGSKRSAGIINDVSSSQAISDASLKNFASSFGDQHAYASRKTRNSDKISIHQTDGANLSHKRKIFLNDAAALPALPFIRDQTIYTTTGISMVESPTADEEVMDDTNDDYLAGDTAKTQFSFSKPSTSDRISGFGYTFSEVYQNRGDTALHQNSGDIAPQDYHFIGQTPYEDMQSISSDEETPIYGLAVLERDERPVQLERMKYPTLDYEMESSASLNEVPDHKEAIDQKENEAQMLAVREKYEAAREILKMIIRIWRQRASIKRETRERRQHLASIAMDALSLGPPLHQNDIQNTKRGDKLSMDDVIQKRDERRDKSWSRLNVAKLVHPILNRKNSMSCHCWKLIFCIHRGAAEDKFDKLICTWLSSKLLGAWNEADDELVVPASYLSIWKDFQYDEPVPESCCFCVVRKVLLDDTIGALNDTTAGANAIIYLLSETLSCQSQRAAIHTLLESISPQASLPLLILCHDASKEATSDIISKFGLNNVEETRISTISVVSLSGQYSEQGGGFLSDDNLKGGLQWLAEQSPIVPALRLVKTRDVMLNFLGSSLQMLTNTRQSEVDPGSYISIFNEALDQSAGLVVHTAKMNVNSWPCPEIDLLESSFDIKVRDTLLASTSWNSLTKTDPILRAIERCKLPLLHNNFSWLGQGSRVKKEILDKKSSLEKLLYNYLTKSTEMMSGDLAAEEARIMVQKGAALELHNSEYYVTPRWRVIFQRIYNWRLRSLTSTDCLFAYVTEDYALPPVEPSSCDASNAPYSSKPEMSIMLEKNGFDDRLLISVLEEPSLDELIESGFGNSTCPELAGEVALNCHLQYTEKDQPCLSQAMDSNRVPCSEQYEENVKDDMQISVYKPEKFTLLLEQCSRLQKGIDEKLSIYF